MSLPRSVAATLVRFGVPADTMAALDDQHHLLGDAVVEAFGALVEEQGLAAHEVEPRHVAGLRARLATRYLHAHHAAWHEGRPTPGFWRDRAMGGGTGLAVPLGDLAEPRTPLVARVAEAARRALGPGQPPPRGLLVASRNTHLGNHPGSFAVDVVPTDLADALVVAEADGRHHTLPGSIGEASGRADDEAGLALVWEVQPNVWKPGPGRNRGVNAVWRAYRSWPVTAALGALAWLLERGLDVLVLDGSALRATHEVDPAAPLGDAIAALHDRTFARAADALGGRLERLEEVPSALKELVKLGLADELERRGPDVLRRLVDGRRR